MLVDDMQLSGLTTKAFRSIHKKLSDELLIAITVILDDLVRDRDSLHLRTYIQQVMRTPWHEQIMTASSNHSRAYCFFLCFVRKTLKESKTCHWYVLDDPDDYYQISEQFVRLRPQSKKLPGGKSLPISVNRLAVISRLEVEALKEHPEYQEYLLSKEWKERRKIILKRSQGRCERCFVVTKLSVHHLHYHSLGNEDPEDLQALCEKCHGEADRQRVERHQ